MIVCIRSRPDRDTRNNFRFKFRITTPYVWDHFYKELAMIKITKILLLFVTISVLTTLRMSDAYSQETQIPGTVQPGQIEKQLKPQPQIPRPIERVIPAPPSVETPYTFPDNLRFIVKKIQLEGSSTYTESDLSPYFSKYLHKTVAVAQIQKLADELTTKYRNDGYILSQVIVPPQRIKDGVVRLQAVEGYIDQVKFDGDNIDRNGLLESYVEKIKQCKPLQSKVLERYLLLMNDLGGVTAQATLAPSSTQSGASNLIITMAQRRLGASLGINNRGSRFLGPWRGELSADAFSVFGLNEHTGLRYISTGSDELNYVSVSHDQHLGSEGLVLGLTFADVESNPDLGAGSITLETYSRSGSIGLTYPLLRSREQNLNVRGNLTYFDSKSAGNDSLLSKDHIRAIRFGATYGSTDAWLGNNQLDLEVSQGLNILDATESGLPNLSRVGGKSDFTKFTLYAARLQALVPNWSIYGAFSGQYALDALLAPEQFAFGGSQFGRAYDAAEIVGDSGVALNLELRFTDTVPEQWLQMYEFYGFYDIGKVWSRQTSNIDSQEASAMSAGLGVRLNFNRWLSGYVELDKPLTRNVAAKNNDDPRVFGGILVTY
jgi:hemolysin activation/secretion protein